ncbi:MAG: DUF4433 domain-containing protein [Nostocales cyanobacterium]|nr:MAG: DUF4433 domain-containing protein [Nostocales cyanobacterium]
MTINPQLNDEVKSIAEQYSGEVLAADYFRYNVQQTKLELTISQPRKPDIFEEFVLQSAINMNNPSTDVEEIANMLCIDPNLIKKTTEKLANYGSLAIDSDAKLHIDSSAQELFTKSCLILEPISTKDAYYIDDPFVESKITNKTIANAPQSLLSLNDYQDNLLDINCKYQEIESLTLSEIQNIIDYSDLRISENQLITNVKEIDHRIEGRKKATIFVIQNNELELLVLEPEINSLSDVLNKLNQEEKLDWEDLFSQKQAVNLYSSALILPDAPESQEIKNFVQERGIEYLVHFTSVENLYGICREGGILSVTKLRELNCLYNQIDPQRLDGKLNHICCSINYYNFLYHYHVSSKSLCWVLLHISPEYIWKENTLFCKFNAATNCGAHIGRGVNRLKSLFDDQVNNSNRIGKPDQQPTCVQAEVMICESISLEDVIRIIVKNSKDVQKVRDAGWESEIEIRPDLFQPRFDWI